MTASKRVKELENSGWIVVEQDPANHRRRIVKLTAHASAAFRRTEENLVLSLPRFYRICG